MQSSATSEYIYDAEQKTSIATFAGECVKDSWKHRWAMETFIANNLGRRYRRSVLGFLWGLLSPLMNMAIMASVFSLIFHMDFKDFAVYLYTGLLPWSFMMEGICEGSQCFINAESYLKKLAIPKLFFPMVAVGTDTCNFLLNLTALLLLSIMLGFQFHATICLLPVVIFITALFNLGLALLVGIATVYVRDLTHILRVTLQAFFYLIPIIYPMSAIPEKYTFLFKLNPFFYPISLFRAIIYEGQLPTMQQWTVTILLALGSLTAGLLFLRRHQDDLIYRL